MPSRPMGFTLVELLVVISIIAVLLAMLVPALDGAIEHALEVRCAANQRQFGLANHLYAHEFRNRFVPIKQPTQGLVGTPASYYEAWYQNLHYAKLMGVTGARVLPYQVSQTGQSVELSLIPSQVADLPPTPAWPVGLMCPNAPDHRLRAAILWNAQGFNWTTGDWTQSIVLRRDRVDRPADKAQMTDSNDWHVMGQGDLATMHRADYKRFWDRHGDGDWVSGFNGMVAYRHTEGAIILHFDGHVAYYTKQSAWHYLESDPNRPHDDRNANLWDVRP